MSTAVRISQATQLDVDTCRRLILVNEPWITLQYGEADAQAIADSASTANVLVAHVAERVVGLALSAPGVLLGEYLRLIAVEQPFQLQGIGRQLMAELERRAFERWPNVYLCVSDFNVGARQFYQRLGYEEVGRLRDLLTPGKDEVLMRKSVGAWRGFRAGERGH